MHYVGGDLAPRSAEGIAFDADASEKIPQCGRISRERGREGRFKPSPPVEPAGDPTLRGFDRGLRENGAHMAFLVTREGDVTVIDVDGQLIVGNRQELKQRVLEEVEQGARKILIDFTETGYIDSSGLGVLVSLSKKIREQGGELRLSSLNEDLRTLFELTKLDSLFRIAGSREEGLAGF